MTVTEYQDKILGILTTFKAFILDPANGISTNPDNSTSEVETRYITSEIADQEQWLGYLRNKKNIVDIWLLTLSGFQGLDDENSNAPIGTFEKPITIIADYFADYKQGVDVTNLKTNSENEFHKKILALDFYLETTGRDCLPNDSRVESWTMKSGIKNFTSGSCHIAKFDIKILFQDIILNNDDDGMV